MPEHLHNEQHMNIDRIEASCAVTCALNVIFGLLDDTIQDSMLELELVHAFASEREDSYSAGGPAGGCASLPCSSSAKACVAWLPAAGCLMAEY